MQWSGGWNAGFSTADPEMLCMPIVSNAIFGYQAVNVESQRRSLHSLLSWMTRIIRIRKSSRVFSRGTLEFLRPQNHHVLAYIREFERNVVLTVNNLSSSAHAVELDLSRFRGFIPIEMFGGNPFPRINPRPYLLTLGPYQFFWFRLRRL
jgi:maltose alpha-D-glucosyltransferase / alpha-amylase